MMKEMAELKKKAKNAKFARNALNILGISDGRIAEDKGNANEEDDDDDDDDDEVDISEVAKTLGQETIEMLSNAKMRYRVFMLHNVRYAKSH